MRTVVALDAREGVVIAGDTRAVTGGTVTSQHVQRVFDLEDVGVGVVGDTGDIQTFRRRFEDELRTARFDDPGNVTVDKLARIAARQAEGTNVGAVVATHDADGTARLREVGADGQVLETEAMALGTGAEIAYGRLETVDSDVGIDDAISTVSEILETVRSRDSESGGDIDVWSLRDEGEAANGQ